MIWVVSSLFVAVVGVFWGRGGKDYACVDYFAEPNAEKDAWCEQGSL